MCQLLNGGHKTLGLCQDRNEVILLWWWSGDVCARRVQNLLIFCFIAKWQALLELHFYIVWNRVGSAEVSNRFDDNLGW